MYILYTFKFEKKNILLFDFHIFFGISTNLPSFLSSFFWSLPPLPSSPSSFFFKFGYQHSKTILILINIGFHYCIPDPYKKHRELPKWNYLHFQFSSNITHGKYYLPTQQEPVGIVPSQAFPPHKPFVDISSQHLRMVSEGPEPICTQTRSLLSSTLLNHIPFLCEKKPIC